MAITKQDIHAAADQLAAVGETPTLAKVRAALGGGSFTTISEAMTEWKAARQQQAVATQIREPAPEAISDRLAEVGAEIWAAALEKANARLTEEREALDEARRKMEATLVETQELAAQFEADLEATQAQVAEQAKHIEQAGVAAAAQAAQVLDLEARLTAQTDAAHTAGAALEEAHKRIDQLGELLEKERTARSEADRQASQAAQAAAKAEAEAAAANRSANEAHKRETAALERAHQAATEAKQARIEEGRAVAQVSAANAAAEAARAEAVTARAEASAAISEAGELRGKLSVLETELEACLAGSTKAKR